MSDLRMKIKSYPLLLKKSKFDNFVTTSKTGSKNTSYTKFHDATGMFL